METLLLAALLLEPARRLLVLLRLVMLSQGSSLIAACRALVALTALVCIDLPTAGP